MRNYYVLSKVSKVRIFGEANERELKDVFIELTIVDPGCCTTWGSLWA
jgi:hypothetical protein